MHYDCLVVDLVNLFHRQHFGRPAVLREVGGVSMEVQGVEGSIEFLHRLQHEYGRPRIHAVVDNYTSGLARRQEIDPGYKSDRQAKSPEFYYLLDQLQELLINGSADLHLTRVDGYEADDLVPNVLEYEGAELVLLISSDLDWARPMTDGVHWFDFKTVFTPWIFSKKYGFRPSVQSIIRFKTYRGDTGDHIPPGCPRLPIGKVLELMEYGSISTVLKDIDCLPVTQIQRRNLRDNERRLRINEKLVGYQVFAEPLESYVRQAVPNYLAVTNICTHLGLDADHLFPGLAPEKNWEDWDH